MKLGELIKCNVRNIFFKNHAENEAGKIILDLFLFFKKPLYKVRASDQHLSLNIVWQTLTRTYINNKLYSISDPQICSVLIFYKKIWD